jgi:hypothetical protein
MAAQILASHAVPVSPALPSLENNKSHDLHRHDSGQGPSRKKLFATARVVEVDACIAIVTAEERQCKNLRTRKILNRIQFELLRLRLTALMPVLKTTHRARVAQALAETKNGKNFAAKAN